MNRQRIHTVAKYLFCIGMAGAAFSELTQSEVVVTSLNAIGVPLRLLYLLVVSKLAGVASLLSSTNRRLTEWAYAGFFFNLVGAIFLLFTRAKPSCLIWLLRQPICLSGG